MSDDNNSESESVKIKVSTATDSKDTVDDNSKKPEVVTDDAGDSAPEEKKSEDTEQPADEGLTPPPDDSADTSVAGDNNREEDKKEDADKPDQGDKIEVNEEPSPEPEPVAPTPEPGKPAIAVSAMEDEDSSAMEREPEPMHMDAGQDLKKEEMTPEQAEQDAEDNLAPVAKPPEEVVDPNTTTAVVGMAASQRVSGAEGKHPHRNNRKLAVLITLLVSAVLAGVAVFVYMSTTKNTEESKNTPVPSSQSLPKAEKQQEVDPATPEDLDEIDKELDEALGGLDDAGDFAEQELSDDSLGL